MHFLALPDDCLLTILQPFALTELFRLRLVCVRFGVVIETVFLSKYSLKLFNDQNQLSNYRLKALRLFGSFDLEDVICIHENRHWITRSARKLSIFTKSFLPIQLLNVRQVVSIIPVSPDSSGIDLVNVLPHWSACLVSLTLFRPDRNKENTFVNIFHQICISMDSLVSLNQLHLFGLLNWTVPADRMAVLSRLEELSLYDYQSDVRPVVAQLDASRMKHLRLTRNMLSESPFESNPQLASSLTHFTVHTYQSRSFTLSNLKTLTYLELSCSSRHFNDLLVQLAQMTTLKELKLGCYQILNYLCFNSNRNVDQLNTFITTRMKPLSSVECFQLTHCEMILHHPPNPLAGHLPRTLSRLFPSLKSFCALFNLPKSTRPDDMTNRITEFFNSHFNHINFTVQRCA